GVHTMPTVACLRLWLAASVLLALTSAGTAAREAPESFSKIAKALLPAVVNISTTQAMPQPEMPPGAMAPGMPPGPEGGTLQEFFGEFFGGNVPLEPAAALGSGFIIDPGGYVVTNHHVVADAQDIVVKLASGRSLHAEVVGSDPATDLALLKVEAGEELPFVRWGRSDKAGIGDWVVRSEERRVGK